MDQTDEEVAAESRCRPCYKGNHEDCVLLEDAGRCVCRWCDIHEKRYGYRQALAGGQRD